MPAVSIRNLTRRTKPLGQLTASLEEIAAETLPGWEISLAFVGPGQARALNKKLRRKTYVPNVLSYAAGKQSGEIIICPSEAAKQAASYRLRPAAYCLLLFIHGLLHLKGWAHGGTMERREQALLARYLPAQSSLRPQSASGDSRTDISTHEATHCHRHRYRNLSGQACRSRRIR